MSRKKKWGKIGSPHSAKRKTYLKKIRRQQGKTSKRKTTTRKQPVRKIKPVSLRQTKQFHKHKKKIPGAIRSRVDNHEVIFGAHALNVRFPAYLERQTMDYDIFSPTPKRDALEAEKALDNVFGGDFFYTHPALHPGTWKVRSYVDQEGYVDYTKPKKKIPYDRIKGKKYVKLSHVKKTIKKTLKDPESSYRHGKDRDALNRIRIYEQMKKKKRSK